MFTRTPFLLRRERKRPGYVGLEASRSCLRARLLDPVAWKHQFDILNETRGGGGVVFFRTYNISPFSLSRTRHFITDGTLKVPAHDSLVLSPRLSLEPRVPLSSIDLQTNRHVTRISRLLLSRFVTNVTSSILTHHRRARVTPRRANAGHLRSCRRKVNDYRQLNHKQRYYGTPSGVLVREK